MITNRQRLALTTLRFAVGGVLAVGAVHLLVRLASGRGPAGYPDWVHWLLGAGEILAALLFLLPRTTHVGGWALIAVLAVAAALHAVAGEVPPPAFLIYVASILVVMAHADPERGATHSTGGATQ